MSIKVKIATRREMILATVHSKVGTYPGANRARTFVDKRHKANKSACRGKGWE